jgi:hypothetical protein
MGDGGTVGESVVYNEKKSVVVFQTIKIAFFCQNKQQNNKLFSIKDS